MSVLNVKRLARVLTTISPAADFTSIMALSRVTWQVTDPASTPGARKTLRDVDGAVATLTWKWSAPVVAAEMVTWRAPASKAAQLGDACPTRPGVARRDRNQGAGDHASH